ncbi:MAG: hypothetical protein IT479_09160 [Xanthomonadales bacterium]|nr:hypothetical protein [Xanthomonadales bacterium]MCC6593432.1 hypothetical protein [Xanthomonadales bacterium]MCE7931315.1 hypothetical protein [Xanthomonadales bacterium PRO6]
MARSFIDTNLLRRVEQHARFQVVIPNVALALAAIDLTRLVSLSFWDALVVEAARAGACGVLLSENLQHGQVIGGVCVVDPFRS